MATTNTIAVYNVRKQLCFLESVWNLYVLRCDRYVVLCRLLPPPRWYGCRCCCCCWCRGCEYTPWYGFLFLDVTLPNTIIIPGKKGFGPTNTAARRNNIYITIHFWWSTKWRYFGYVQWFQWQWSTCRRGCEVWSHSDWSVHWTPESF